MRSSTFALVAFALSIWLLSLASASTPIKITTSSGTSASEPASFHIVFSTECTPYFDWQTLGLLSSYVKVKQAGKITRLMACDDENYGGKDLTDRFPNADTYVHRNYAKHPTNGDEYPAYNKPYSILSWLNETEPEEDFIVFLDADMVIRSRISVEAVGAKRGTPVSALYGYLKGVDPDSFMEIKRSVPNVEKADKVGGFMVMHKEDMRSLAPWWLHYTEEVRTNPKNWANTGDVFNDNGKRGPPWISEMYGYIFGCAHVGLRHIISNDFMLYPGYQPPPEPFPLVIHYGITFYVDDYAFDKHWFNDLTTCPGRNIDLPLSLEEISYQRENDGEEAFRRNSLALYAPQVIHEALEDHRRVYCNSSVASEVTQQFRHKYECEKPRGIIQCKPASELQGEELQAEIRANKNRGKRRDGDLHKQGSSACEDTHDLCCSWAESGECAKNADYMMERCKASCGLCGKSSCLDKQGSRDEGSEGKHIYSPLEMRDKNKEGHFFGRDRHHFIPKSNVRKVDSNVFNGANDALFRALPYWGSMCVIGVVGVSAIQLLGSSLRRRPKAKMRRPVILV